VEQIGDEQELGKVAEQTGDEQEQEKVAEQIGDEQELVKVAEQTGDEQEPEKVVEQTGDERGLEKAAAQTGDGRELERAAEQTGDLHLVVTSAHVANTPMSSLIAHTHIHTPVVPLRVVTSSPRLSCSVPTQFLPVPAPLSVHSAFVIAMHGNTCQSFSLGILPRVHNTDSSTAG